MLFDKRNLLLLRPSISWWPNTLCAVLITDWSCLPILSIGDKSLLSQPRLSWMQHDVSDAQTSYLFIHSSISILLLLYCGYLDSKSVRSFVFWLLFLFRLIVRVFPIPIRFVCSAVYLHCIHDSVSSLWSGIVLWLPAALSVKMPVAAPIHCH